MVISAHERSLVRRLARDFLDHLDEKERARRIEQWRAVNSLRPVPPPIYVRAFAWATLPEARLECSRPVCRELEGYFRRQRYRMRFNDDYVFQPWYQSGPVYEESGWGLAAKHRYAGSTDTLEAFKEDHPLKSYDDLAKLVFPRHRLDAAATALKEEELNDLIGDLMPVEMYRGMWAWGWSGDLATAIGHLRGIENLMLDVYDEPDGLKALADFLMRGLLSLTDEASAAGGLTRMCHMNQAMPYADTLADPAPNTPVTSTRELWHFDAAQEFALVGPEQHEEFLLRYQLPIMSRYGLVAYGCCEDLTRKIPVLRQIPNLRRLAVSPFADVAACAEQIGRDYTISYRPNPALLASGYRREAVGRQLEKDFDALAGTIFDLTLKDVETVEGDPGRVVHFVEDARRLIDRRYR